MKKRISVFCIAVIWGMILPTLTFAKESIPIPVYDVNEPAMQPFQQELDFDFEPTQLGAGKSFFVPSGKRLVIEFVSANIGLSTSKAVSFAITTNANGTIAHHRLLLNELWPNSNFLNYYNVSQNMRIYADPGTEVNIHVNSGGGEGSVFATISGYLVDFP